MTRREAISPHWSGRLAALGMRSLERLLSEGPEAGELPGRWEALSKPGLGGRMRWHWALPADAPPDRPEDGDSLFVKCYRHSSLREQWDRILRQSPRHSRAFWEFEQCRRLAQASIDAPAPVGFVEEMSGQLERRSAVLLGRVAGDALDRFWTAAVAEGAPITHGRARHDLTRRLGRFVAAFHGTGLCHRDLYLCHVFIAASPAYDAPPRFALIDLARAHQPRWRRMRWIIKDLAQLDASAQQVGASRTDRVRFLLAYLGLQAGAPRVRWYARRVVRKSDWILRRIASKNAKT